MDETEQERAVFGQSCPRCGATIPPKIGGAGRPRVWCSQACRRAAYEERRAAKNGAIAVELRERPAEPARVVEIETVRYETREVHHEPTVADALVVVLNDADASAPTARARHAGGHRQDDRPRTRAPDPGRI